MDTKKDEEKEGCGSGCGCGCCSSGCGRRCAGKAALALVLLVIGGLIGYGMGVCGRGKCHMMPSCPMSAPMAPPAK